MEGIKRSKGITIFAWLAILFASYKPLAEIIILIVSLNRKGLLAGNEWPIVKLSLKIIFFGSLGTSYKGIEFGISKLGYMLPVYQSYITKVLSIAIAYSKPLITIMLLVSAIGLLKLKRTFLRLLIITAYIIIAFNVINIPLVFGALKNLESGYQGYLFESIIFSIIKILFFLIVAYFFTRPKVKAQFTSTPKNLGEGV